MKQEAAKPYTRSEVLALTRGIEFKLQVRGRTRVRERDKESDRELMVLPCSGATGSLSKASYSPSAPSFSSLPFCIARHADPNRNT